jgi:hypothetical protein
MLAIRAPSQRKASFRCAHKYHPDACVLALVQAGEGTLSPKNEAEPLQSESDETIHHATSAEIRDEPQPLQIDEAIHHATAALLGANRAIRDRDHIIATVKAENSSLQAENAYLKSQLQELRAQQAVALLSNLQNRARKADAAGASSVKVDVKTDVAAAPGALAAAAGGSSYADASTEHVITHKSSSSITVKTESADSPHTVPDAAAASAPLPSPIAASNLDQLIAAAAGTSSDLMPAIDSRPFQK